MNSDTYALEMFSLTIIKCQSMREREVIAIYGTRLGKSAEGLPIWDIRKRDTERLLPFLLWILRWNVDVRNSSPFHCIQFAHPFRLHVLPKTIARLPKAIPSSNHHTHPMFMFIYPYVPSLAQFIQVQSTSKDTSHHQIPSGFEALPFPALLTAFVGFFFSDMFCELPCPASPKGLPPVATRGPPTPTASLMLLP